MEMKITFPGGKKVKAEFDGAVVETDQPVKYGGEGSAPTPYQLFLASLGTCAGIFILGFCNERKIPTEGITLTQRMEYIPKLKGGAELKKVIIEINLPPGFPEKYEGAVVKVAELCAVKKTIQSPPEFEIRTVPG
jgi:ribosomal protein S12 methylthiotransferase accessory factor